MDTNIIIFGHSHASELDKDSWFLKEKRIYANCGAWCDEAEQCTFVETEKYEETLSWLFGLNVVKQTQDFPASVAGSGNYDFATGVFGHLSSNSVPRVSLVLLHALEHSSPRP